MFCELDPDYSASTRCSDASDAKCNFVHGAEEVLFEIDSATDVDLAGPTTVVGGEPLLAAAVPIDSPGCSCKLTRVPGDGVARVLPGTIREGQWVHHAARVFDYDSLVTRCPRHASISSRCSVLSTSCCVVCCVLCVVLCVVLCCVVFICSFFFLVLG